MTTSVHKNLTGSDLHEPKGADTALVGTVYVSDGAGSGSWQSASSIITNQAFTTGDAKLTYKTSADTGWVIFNDGTLGDSSSGGTTRANADTSALFTLLYGLPVGLTVSGGRGANAAADFAAHKTITLPKTLGRALAVYGAGSGLTSRALGDLFSSAETITLLTANLPPYTPVGTVASSSAVTGGNAGLINGSNSGSGFSSGGVFPASTSITVTTTSTFTGTAQGGVSTAFTNMQPTAFINVMVKL